MILASNIQAMAKILKGLLFSLTFLAGFIWNISPINAIPTLKGNLEWRTCPLDKPIKGNINKRKGSKIYHKPTGAFYKRTNPEQCFATSLEAEAAGFRASKR